ncbi:uncharacterized protein [Embiotoca jacksoni]|uniref:uncharacterized protein n=1 Tax=Embiotoca jacksoni TaxID=100190 RepID=UPI003704C463
MVDNIIQKCLGFILIITVHMVLNGPSYAEVTGILGNSITLQFIFNVSIHNYHHLSIYITGETKIADYSSCKDCFEVHPENASVFYRITNLSLNNSQTYWAILFLHNSSRKMSTITTSNRVQLIVRVENKSTTVSPVPTTFTTTQGNGNHSLLSNDIVTVLVVLPVLLLAAVLPALLCCLMKTKDKQLHPQPLPQSSNATLQETVEASNNVPAPSLIYSVLDFPKRAPAVVEMNPSDTEYAAVSYPSDNKRAECKPAGLSWFK